MEPLVDLDLGGLRLRTLTSQDEDAALLVEATRSETAPALWGPRPAGSYSLEAARSALHAWDPNRGGQVSFGVLDGPRLVAALGLMPDRPQEGSGERSSAELAYWVRPEHRRRGIAVRGVQALTAWAHTAAGISRVWLEIDPGNTPSLQVARRAGYRFEQRLPRHCRAWRSDDPRQDAWHDCLIWVHSMGSRPGGHAREGRAPAGPGPPDGP
jgi:RimJ/RimL family protein N-acetyltransferase